MSAASNAVCHSILLGRCRYSEYDKAVWHGSAEATWDALLEWFDAACNGDDIQQGMQGNDGLGVSFEWRAYLYRCETIGGENVAFKIGITSQGKQRIRQHDNNPLLRWHECRQIQCGSKSSAEFIENYVLAAAAKSGSWLGGEWISV